ncbi:MAG TPA: glycogen synthase [Terrimicrobiaceae bacterium]|nr:glycogen synthase [Terrimicrobiaceae bacterium]
MNILFLTNEFPPHIYGGAGIHVQYLSRELAKLMPVHVRCFGDQNVTSGNLSALGFSLNSDKYTCPKPLRSVFGALQRSLDFNTVEFKGDLVHCHTWYVHWGGILAKLNYGIPLVITVHSLEPLRPWKREQLGGGYDFTCWLEKTAIEMADAVIAVSRETRADIERLFDVRPEKVHVIYNGIDLEEYKHVESRAALKRFGINPVEPYILFVGRITRQKGIIHLVNAIKHLNEGFQIVLCAGAPDTPEIGAEMKAAVAAGQRKHSGVIWIEEMVDTKTKIELYSNAAVFVCPSIYEPFGIINLEAMACATPVVATAVGGIKEVVVHGETGYLVSIDQMQESPFEPVAPERFSRDLAARINELMADPAKRKAFGEAGRSRAEEIFGWPAIAQQTAKLYESLIKQK